MLSSRSIRPHKGRRILADRVVVFSDREQTEAQGVPNLGHIGNCQEFGLQTGSKFWKRPQFDSQTVDPPKVQRYWHRQWQEHIGPRPITNGDHGEANEYEGDAHDEDNDEKDGVGVFFPHIFLHSFSLLAFLWTAFHVYVLVYFNLNVHVHILFPVLFRSIYSKLMSIFPIPLFSSCQSPCLCLSCLMFNVQFIIDSYTQSINKAPFVEEMYTLRCPRMKHHQLGFKINGHHFIHWPVDL